jgi:hypothetical protein
MSKIIRFSLSAQEKQSTDWSKCFICQEDKHEGYDITTFYWVDRDVFGRVCFKIKAKLTLNPMPNFMVINCTTVPW